MSTVTAGSPTETGRRERSQHPLVVQDRPHHRDRDSETLCSVSWTQAAWINWCLSHPKPPRWCWSTEKNTFLLFTFKHFLPSIFSHFISSTLDFLQGSTKVWSLTGFPLWHPDNRECVHLILLKCAFDAFTSRHVQHCQCFAADSRATDKKTNKFAQN